MESRTTHQSGRSQLTYAGIPPWTDCPPPNLREPRSNLIPNPQTSSRRPSWASVGCDAGRVRSCRSYPPRCPKLAAARVMETTPGELSETRSCPRIATQLLLWLSFSRDPPCLLTCLPMSSNLMLANLGTNLAKLELKSKLVKVGQNWTRGQHRPGLVEVGQMVPT